MAAARDVEPVYYERYMIDYNNKPVADQQGAQDRIHWFFSMDYAGRRQVLREHGHQRVLREQLSWRWPNWAKLFFNNKGVVGQHRPTSARTTRPTTCLCGLALVAKFDEDGAPSPVTRRWGSLYSR